MKLITEQMSSQFGSSGKKKKRNLITLKTSMLKMQTKEVLLQGAELWLEYRSHLRTKWNLNVRFILNSHIPHYDMYKQQLITFINKMCWTFKLKLPR